MRNISPVQGILLKSFIPKASDLENVIGNIASFNDLCRSKSLRNYLSKNKPVATIFLCGHGDEFGFYCTTTRNLISPIRVDDDWWRHNMNINVYLFAFTCNSYKYLRNSQIMRYLSGAIGYKDTVWLYIDPDDPSTGSFWIKFFRRLYKLLTRAGTLDEDTYLGINRLYTKYCTKKTGIKGLFSFADNVDYLNRICLVKQLRSLDIV